MGRPQISILMPVRDGERYLAQALESLERQSLRDFELVVVDDGSTDATAGILSRHAARDPRLRVLRNERMGLVRALNAGLSACRAPYIARMDADDVALPERLQQQADFLEANPSVIALGGQIEIIDPDGRRLRVGRYPLGPEACRAHLCRAASFCHPAVMFRAEPVRRLGGYRAAFRHAEDLDLWLRLEAMGDFDNLPSVVIQYRTHPGSVTASHAEEQAVAAALALACAAMRRQGLTDPTPSEGWQSTNWPDIKDAFADRETASILHRAYHTALVLNGGVASERGWRALYSEALAMRRGAPGDVWTDREWGYVMSRAAVQLWRRGQGGRALKILSAGLFTVGWAMARELLLTRCS